MNNQTLVKVTLLTLLVSAVGCAHPFYATRIRPAEVDLHDVRRLAIYGISGDDGPPLEAAITEGLVEATPKRFDVLDRDQFKSILKRETTEIINDAAVSKDVQTVAEVLPATAAVYGKVFETAYDESVRSEKSSCATTQGNKVVMVPCMINKRTGVVTYGAEIKLVSLESGRVLASKQLKAQTSATTEATDGEPGGINRGGLLGSARADAASQFLHMVQPYKAQERVELESDGDVKELELGNRYLRAGDLESALNMYRDAMARIQQPPALDSDTKAKVYYSFALGLALTGEYAQALDELKEANRLSGDAEWLEFETRIKQWRAEAERLSGQNAALADSVAANSTSSIR